jgi:hypothetical protein
VVWERAILWLVSLPFTLFFGWQIVSSALRICVVALLPGAASAHRGEGRLQRHTLSKYRRFAAGITGISTDLNLT